MTPSSAVMQQQTVAECARLRESCPALTWIKLAVPFAGLIVVAVAGCWGVSLWAFGLANGVNTKFEAHAAGEVERDEAMQKTLDAIRLDIKDWHPKEGE